MSIKVHEPKQAPNNTFLKLEAYHNEIENFKANHIPLIDYSNEYESKEFHMNLGIDFLKKTYYDPEYFINIKERNDLVIHTGGKENSKDVMIDQLGFGVSRLDEQEIGVMEGGCHDN